MKKKFTQSKWLVTMILLVTAMAMPKMAWAEIKPEKPSSGDGRPENPFQISTPAELYWFAAHANGENTSAYAVLVNDITVNTGVLNADGTLVSNVSGFNVWTPIGDDSQTTSESGHKGTLYNGTFDGQGHTISGLYFNNSTTAFVGLFGCIGRGKIFNVGVVDSYFNGNYYVGGVCGCNYYGEISNCYSAGAVSGSTQVGGVCGYNSDGTISNCYSAGAVSGSSHVGGVCGYNSIGTISNCYFDNLICKKEAVGTNIDGTVTSTEGKTTAQFASGEVCYLLNKGKTDGTQAWYQNLAKEGGDTYPVLKSNVNYTVYASQPCPLKFSNTPVTNEHVLDNGFCKECGGYEQATLTTDQYDINGDGQNDEVYKIGNAGQLYWFAGLINGTLTDGTEQNNYANAVLVNDITVNSLNGDGSIKEGTPVKNWTPIGNSQKSYKGTFDGQSHTVSGLYFDNSATDYVGLFGYIYFGKISNVGVVDSYFNGREDVGGVCGCNKYGTIRNCYSAGSVSGGFYVGGVCGHNDSGTINNNSGTISNCYSACAVTGEVSGSSSVGGVCGQNDFGNISNCYFDSDECDKDAVGTKKNGNVTSTEGKTKEQFASGEVCYLLNGSSPYGEWGQQIGTNDYPIIGSAYKVLKAAQDGQEGTNYWATFSNKNSNAELMASAGKITVYNATVSGGTLTLTKRNDNKVASGEGVLLKANCEYVNAMNISDEVSAAATEENHLVATPETEQTINAGSVYKLYRLTYNNVSTKTDLGFYLGIVGESKDGSQLAATPGKAYLKVSTGAATKPGNAAPARGFVFPGDDETTGIGEIVIEGEAGINGSANADGRIYNLQGQQVTAPVKGLYIKNNKKVIIK